MNFTTYYQLRFRSVGHGTWRYWDLSAQGPTEHVPSRCEPALGPGQRHSCLCSVLTCHCCDSAGFQHDALHSVLPGLSSGAHTYEGMWVQGKGVYFLPLKTSVWKVNGIKLVCTLKKYFPFLASVRLIFSEWCEQKFTAQGQSLPPKAHVPGCPGRNLHNSFFQSCF